jgi:hypothetical protein
MIFAGTATQGLLYPAGGGSGRDALPGMMMIRIIPSRNWISPGGDDARKAVSPGSGGMAERLVPAISHPYASPSCPRAPVPPCPRASMEDYRSVNDDPDDAAADGMR